MSNVEAAFEAADNEFKSIARNREKLNELRSEGTLTQKGLDQWWQHATAGAEQTADNLASAAQKHAQEATNLHDRYLRSYGDVDASDTAAELRTTRAWNRAQRILDNEPTAAGKVARAAMLARTTDPSTIRALREELGGYLAAYHARADASKLITDGLHAVDPKARELGQRATRAQQLHAVANAQAGRIRARIKGGQTMPGQTDLNWRKYFDAETK